MEAPVRARHVIKRVQLPLPVCRRLQREARRRHCSVSALVIAAVRRDLREGRAGHKTAAA